MLGTSVSVSIGDRYKTRRHVVDIVFQEIERVEGIFSTFQPNSSISRLNRDGHLVNCSSEIVNVISRALNFSSLSGGAFDITVKPVLDLYQEFHRKQLWPPSEQRLKIATSLVDFRNVVVDDDTIFLKSKGAQITTDAIAKGYIIDRAIRVLRNAGVNSAFVDIGGDSRGIGEKADGTPWIVALQNPREFNQYLAVIRLRNRAVATSGDYERYFVPNKKVHHIIDPRTGRSATSLISATVTAKIAMDADALATTVFVLGPEQGLSLVNRLDGVEALLVTQNRTVLKSKGFDVAN